MKSKMVLVAFLLVLYIGPSIFISSYASSAIPTKPNMTKDFSIAEDWYEEEWHYRKSISISVVVEGVAGTDYQMRIPVTYDSHMQTDFDDIRFTDDDGETLLDHWRETYTVSTSAVFWVEVADNLDSSQDIYMYYGNAGASTASNGKNTFGTLYEDWINEAVNNSIWTTTDNDGTISWDDTDAIHGSVAKIEGGAGTDRQGYASIAHGTAPTSLMFRAKIESTLASDQEIRIGATSLSFFGFGVIQTGAGTETFYVYDDDGNQDTQAMDGTAFDSYGTFEITRDETNVKLYMDNELIETASWAPDAVDQVYTMFSCRDTEKDLYLDWMLVRKFVATEPTIGSWGEEESNIPPPAWKEAGEAELLFVIPVDETGLNMLLIFLGLCMIPFSTLFLVWGGKNNMNSDKLFFGLIAFVMGWALFLGGIM